MGIVTAVMKIVKNFTDKRVCTVDQFMSACKVASEQASKDKDGFIQIIDTLKIAYAVYKTSRKS